MKKYALILFIIILFTQSTFLINPISRPDKGTGAVLGRIYLEMLNAWKSTSGEMRAGKYYKGLLYLINNNTGEREKIKSDNKGYYLFMDLEPGVYTIYRFDYRYTSGYTNFFLNIPIDKNGIKFEVFENKITVLKTVRITKRTVGDAKSTGFTTSLQDMITSFEYIDESDETINNFKKKDRRNFWADFEFINNEDNK